LVLGNKKGPTKLALFSSFKCLKKNYFFFLAVFLVAFFLVAFLVAFLAM